MVLEQLYPLQLIERNPLFDENHKPIGLFDYVINVESCHRYENIGQFLKEVRRVLRPGGFFLVTDRDIGELERATTGEGRQVDISMLDVMAALHTYRAKYFFVAGEIPKPVGTAHVSSVPLRAYKTKDTYIVIEAFMDHFWRNLCSY